MVVGENEVSFLLCSRAPVFLLTACRSLTSFFSIKSFEGFLQEYPRYFEGVPLSYKEFMFNISDHTTRDMAESEVVNLSKSEDLEYP